jgi:hypothetical protein
MSERDCRGAGRCRGCRTASPSHASYLAPQGPQCCCTELTLQLSAVSMAPKVMIVSMRPLLPCCRRVLSRVIHHSRRACPRRHRRFGRHRASVSPLHAPNMFASIIPCVGGTAPVYFGGRRLSAVKQCRKARHARRRPFHRSSSSSSQDPSNKAASVCAGVLHAVWLCYGAPPVRLHASISACITRLQRSLGGAH